MARSHCTILELPISNLLSHASAPLMPTSKECDTKKDWQEKGFHIAHLIVYGKIRFVTRTNATKIQPAAARFARQELKRRIAPTIATSSTRCPICC